MNEPNTQPNILHAPPRTVAPLTSPRVMLIYGPEKQGKTEICARLPGARIIDMDEYGGGTKYIANLAHEPFFPKSLKDINDFCDACAAEREATGKWPYQFTIWDHLIKVEDLVEEDETIKFQKNPIGKGFMNNKKWDGRSLLDVPGNDGGGGPGWGPYRMGLKTTLAKTVMSAPNVIWIAHLKETMGEKKDARDAFANEVDLVGKNKFIVTRSADAFAVALRNPLKMSDLVLSFRPRVGASQGGGGGRCKHLEGKEFVISTMQADGTLKVNWELIYPELAAPKGGTGNA